MLDLDGEEIKDIESHQPPGSAAGTTRNGRGKSHSPDTKSGAKKPPIGGSPGKFGRSTATNQGPKFLEKGNILVKHHKKNSSINKAISEIYHDSPEFIDLNQEDHTDLNRLTTSVPNVIVGEWTGGVQSPQQPQQNP